MKRSNRKPLFHLGRIVATPGALDLLGRTGTSVSALLRQHQCGDRGAVCPADRKSNDLAVSDGARILSSYELGAGKEKVWILTEADRCTTTALLPSEY
jgi:hypothetical protein